MPNWLTYSKNKTKPRTVACRNRPLTLLNYDEKFIFRGVVLWTESGKPDLWWLPSHHESPPKDFEKPRLPPYGASSFWGLNPKSGPDQTPPCVPSRPGPPRPGGFACPPSSADQAIP